MRELYIHRKIVDSIDKTEKLLENIEEFKKREKAASQILKSLTDNLKTHDLEIKNQAQSMSKSFASGRPGSSILLNP